MKIYIKSRAEIEKYDFPPKTALISISDADDDFPILRKIPDFLLKLAFEDVDNDIFCDELKANPTEKEIKEIAEKYHQFSDEQADDTARFYFTIKKKAEILICQCEHGQSRSAAVAAAIQNLNAMPA